jgi:septal ring factor EnvC (AmiA/AmiB activator)
MTSKKPQVRLEEWLEKDVEDYMKKHPKLSRTKTLHQYIIDLKQQKEESTKEIKRSREEARHHRKKAEKAEKLAAKDHQKADSTSKPQIIWEAAPDWRERLRAPIKSDWGKLRLFPSYLKKELAYPLDCRKCKKDPNSPHQQCIKLYEIFEIETA